LKKSESLLSRDAVIQAATVLGLLVAPIVTFDLLLRR
jgi:hypothetical protein